MHFIKIAAVLAGTIFVMNALHELGHALMAKALGYDVVMTINGVSEASGDGFLTLLHTNLVSAAGPVVTILLALAAYLWRERLGFLAPIVIWAAMTMRLLAAIFSLSLPNDEARISASLGLGMWTLPVAVVAGLVLLFILIARETKLGWRWYLAAWAGMSVGYSAVILGEDYLPAFAF